MANLFGAIGIVKVGNIDTPVLLVGEQVAESAVEGLKGDVLRVAEGLLQSISSTFYKQLLLRYSFTKKLQSQIVIKEKLSETLSYEKVESKMLMKLTP